MKRLLLVLGMLGTFAVSPLANAEEQVDSNSVQDTFTSTEQSTVAEETIATEGSVELQEVTDEGVVPVIEEGSTAQEESLDQIAPRMTYTPVYRLYNPNSGGHHFTISVGEKQMLKNIGWRDEGVAWQAPRTKGGNIQSVYRSYNANTGEHLFTTNFAEANLWKYEGTAFYAGLKQSATTPSGVYRLFNPNTTGAGSHHYTTNKAEVDMLVGRGWRDEKIKFWVFPK